MIFNTTLREGALYLVPEEYWWFSKLIFLFIMFLACTVSFVKTLTRNKKRVKKIEEKSATVKAIRTILWGHVLYGILFVDIFPSLFTGATLILCFVCCSIHWKSTKCNDFPDFFAVKSGWLTSLISLSIGQFLVGSIYGSILPRLVTVITSVVSLWMISLVYSLIRFKKYYKKEKNTKPDNKDKNGKDNKNGNNVKKDGNNKTDGAQKNNGTKNPKNEIPLHVTDETDTVSTVKEGRASCEEAHAVEKDESSVTAEYVNSIIDSSVEIHLTNKYDKTVKPTSPLDNAVINENFENQLRNCMMTKIYSVIKLYFEAKVSEELVGDANSVVEMESFDPTDFENIEIDINFSTLTETVNENVFNANSVSNNEKEPEKEIVKEEVNEKNDNTLNGEDKTIKEEQTLNKTVETVAMLTLNLDGKTEPQEAYLVLKDDEDKK